MSGRRITLLDRRDRPAPNDDAEAGPDRREALKLLAASLALGLAGCSGRPDEEIMPYVNMPERLVPGVPLQYASTLPLAGFGRGVVCISMEGRPIKVEGNPLHPASLGATDPFAEAAVLGLYDPDRSQAIRAQGQLSGWDAFLAALLPRLASHAARQGAGLRFLTERTTSPTLLRQMGLLRQRFPQARWHGYQPTEDDNARQGAIQAFGRPLAVLPHLDRADVVLALDADPLGAGPAQIRNARAFSQRRLARGGSASLIRLYAVEPSLTLTGANADHRLALAPQLIRDVALAVASAVGAPRPAADLPEAARRFAEAAGKDLAAHKGRALVLAGPTQPPEIHALAHWINAQLQAPVDVIEPLDAVADSGMASLKSLAADMAAGQVESLVILGANPAYDAPAELGFVGALGRVPFRVHFGLYFDETAALCDWHIPASHPLESWSDLRAVDGTASIVQPLIRPLYETRTAHEFLGAFLGRLDVSSHALVRETWQAESGAADFEAWWRKVLHDGVVPDSAAKPVTPPAPQMPQVAPGKPAQGLTLVLRPDPSVWDGSVSNNAWLQECPKPFTKEVWGNALLTAPADASARGLKTGDVVRLEVGGRGVEAPVLVDSGQAAGTLTLTLGYGRWKAGAIGNGLGANAYELRQVDAAWAIEGATLTRLGRHRDILTTQKFFELEGNADTILPALTTGELAKLAAVGAPHEVERPTLYPQFPYKDYAWAMVIDTTLCIGCNACVIACQAENNVPVVGPAEIAELRFMHWLRIDTYDHGGPDGPRPAFQPVPCMHCEHAPCEPVCPVEASVHDHSGLNTQVYNRCIGTRFCESNCPYKVRRFNFFGYAEDQAYANLDADTIKAQRNPNVTVRARGVMEKCTYCVQRISLARSTAEQENRRIGEGEVVTACQAACPTRAISFGDLNIEDSAINKLRHEPQHYAMLGELNTRPRTTYLAWIRNPNPELEAGKS